ncbi:hypothetical protein JYG52_24210, partial [Escherichia fergusonii]|nr:hypothetical protein [Escherichia fergusonii]
MIIDKKLNLAIPLERANGQTIHIHSTPIAEQTFRQHFEIIAQVHSAVFGEGYGALAGPRVAAMLLRKIAEHHDAWSGPGGVEMTLMAEIR